MWQERKRIGGYTIESEDKNGGIVTYISPDLDELNEVKDSMTQVKYKRIAILKRYK